MSENSSWHLNWHKTDGRFDTTLTSVGDIFSSLLASSGLYHAKSRERRKNTQNCVRKFIVGSNFLNELMLQLFINRKKHFKHFGKFFLPSRAERVWISVLSPRTPERNWESDRARVEREQNLTKESDERKKNSEGKRRDKCSYHSVICFMSAAFNKWINFFPPNFSGGERRRRKTTRNDVSKMEINFCVVDKREGEGKKAKLGLQISESSRESFASSSLSFCSFHDVSTPLTRKNTKKKNVLTSSLLGLAHDDRLEIYDL